MVPFVVSVAVVAGLTSCSSDSKSDDTAKAATTFLTTWQGGDIDAAAALTDNPTQASQQMKAAAQQLSLIKATYQPTTFSKGKGKDSAGSQAYKATVTVQGIADPVSWDSAVPMVKKNGRTLVHWQSTVINPQLTDDAKFSLTRSTPARGQIVDRNGRPLAQNQAVVKIWLYPSQVTDEDAVMNAFRDPVFDVDVDDVAGKKGLRSRLDAAKAGNQRVDVITLKRTVWDSTARAKLDGLAGVRYDEAQQAVSGGLASQLIGTTGAATADTLKNAGPAAADGDTVGVTGLQYRYQKVLAGTPTVKLTIVDGSKQTKATLAEVKGTDGKPVKTTLDPTIQKNAETTMAKAPVNAGMVVLKASTGEILAAANNPPTGSNRAFTGQYPPGSTFKIVTSAALLGTGLKPTDDLPCKSQVVINGQKFENQDALGQLPDPSPFALDFAKSCNTAFISQAGRLKDDTLNTTAKSFGIGGEWDVGAATFDGSVPAATSPNEKAADMIGQGRVATSPLVMASIVATVKSGQFHQPTLVPDQVKPYQAPSKLDPGVADQIRQMMRGTVAQGTAVGLKGVPGDLGAKTGTAEFGNDNPPHMHAWLVVFKDDYAVAMLLEDGGKNSPKVQMMKDFLSTLH